MTWLAGQGAIPIPMLFLGYGLAFGAYLGALLVVRRVGLPLWIWLAAAVLLRAPWLPAGLSLSDDAWRYLHDGRAQVAGVNPYRYPPSAPEAASYGGPDRALINNPALPTIYPPAAQLAFRAAVHLGGTLLAWKVLLLLADVGVGAALAWWLRSTGTAPGLAAVYLLHPLPIIEFAGNGHVDALGIAALVASLALLAHSGVSSGAALAVSTAAKYVALPLLPFLVRSGPWARRLAVLGGAVGTLALVYAPFLDHPPIGSLRVFARRFTFNAPLYSGLALVTSPEIARAVLAAALLAILLWLWKHGAPPRRATPVWLAAVLLASPIVHPWYVTWLIPFLAWYRWGWALAWTGTVVLSYAVLPGWRAHRVWDPPAWAIAAEYAPVYGLLLWGWIDGVRRRRLAPRSVGGPLRLTQDADGQSGQRAGEHQRGDDGPANG